MLATTELCLRSFRSKSKLNTNAILIPLKIVSSAYYFYSSWYNRVLTLLYSCLGHVINLSSQALIKMYSQSPHYDPALPDNDITSGMGLVRDEIGLIRAIAVKVGSHLEEPTSWVLISLIGTIVGST